MAKPFNQLLHDDIIMLKGINREKFSEEFRRAFGNIMKRYNISRTMVYEELEKIVPGSYKKHESKSRHIIISKKEIALVRDMVTTGKTIRHISKTMSLELGFRYTPYRIYKVKELLLSGKNISSPLPIAREAASPASARLLEEGNNVTLISQDEPVVFKGNIRRLFYRLSMINFIDPERAVKINIAGTNINSSSRVIKDCFSHIIYSASCDGKNLPDSFHFDMETLLINELEQVKLGNRLSPAALKQLEGIRKSLLLTAPENGERSSLNGGYTLDDIYRAVRHYAPNVTRDDVIKYMGMEENPPQENT